MVNLFSGNMFSFDFRKTSAPDYQRRLLRPWPTSPLRCMWAAVTVLLGHRSIRCGPRLRHVGHDYGETKNAAHMAESRPTSHRNQWPTSNGITGPHRPEYASLFSITCLFSMRLCNPTPAASTNVGCQVSINVRSLSGLPRREMTDSRNNFFGQFR
jgi:hypothetical protein